MSITVGAHPSRFDFVVHAGEAVDFTISDLTSNGAAVTSLTNWTAAAQIRTAPDSPTVLATLTAVVDGLTVHVTATAAATAAWAWPGNSAQWDLVLTSPALVPHILCAGWVRLYPSITR